MKTKKLTGIYWHCHHDIICEYVYDYQERVDYIKKEKPKNEIKTRLRLFKPVKVKLPKEFVQARENYFQARDKYVQAEEKYVPQLEELHKKDCGCSEWNGKEIVFK